jgi:hypothetical protein
MWKCLPAHSGLPSMGQRSAIITTSVPLMVSISQHSPHDSPAAPP